jgi:hypothetical protein
VARAVVPTSAKLVCRAEYPVRFFEADPGLWAAEAMEVLKLATTYGATLAVAQSQFARALAANCAGRGIEVGRGPEGEPDIHFTAGPTGEELWRAEVYGPRAKAIGPGGATTEKLATDFRHVWAKLKPSPFTPGPPPSTSDREAAEHQLASLAWPAPPGLSEDELEELVSVRLLLHDPLLADGKREEAARALRRLTCYPTPQALPEDEREARARQASVVNRRFAKPALPENESRDAVRDLLSWSHLLDSAGFVTPEMDEFAYWLGCKISRAGDAVAALMNLRAPGRSGPPTPVRRNKQILAEIARQQVDRPNEALETLMDDVATIFSLEPEQIAKIYKALLHRFPKSI